MKFVAMHPGCDISMSSFCKLRLSGWRGRECKTEKLACARCMKMLNLHMIDL